MAMFKSFFYLLVILVFIVAGLVFSFRNHSLVNVDLLFFQSDNFSIGFWLLLSLLVGVVLGISLVFPNRLVQRLKIHQLSKKVIANKVPQVRVKAEPIKGK